MFAVVTGEDARVWEDCVGNPQKHLGPCQQSDAQMAGVFWGARGNIFQGAVLDSRAASCSGLVKNNGETIWVLPAF